jgi:hypothetical protein
MDVLAGDILHNCRKEEMKEIVSDLALDKQPVGREDFSEGKFEVEFVL